MWKLGAALRRLFHRQSYGRFPPPIELTVGSPERAMRRVHHQFKPPREETIGSGMNVGFPESTFFDCIP